MRVKAYAKINLSLNILGKRPDGFHEIESVMQSVSLCDVITLSEIPSGIQVVTTNLKLPADNRNLAYKAAEKYFRKLKAGGVKIHIEKNIPVAAGLAGGSADAAAVLYGLNQLATSNLRLTTSEILKLGEQIGSDVPFCLIGGSCTVTGRGEKVKRNMLHAIRSYVLVVPEIEVSTQWAYEAWDAAQMTNQGIRNQLEPVVIKKYPIVQKIKDRLLGLGCSYAQMSGSGPGVFGVVKDQAAGEKILSAVRGEFPRSFLAQGVETGLAIA